MCRCPSLPCRNLPCPNLRCLSRWRQRQRRSRLRRPRRAPRRALRRPSRKPPSPRSRNCPARSLIMSRGERAWADDDIHVEPEMAGARERCSASAGSAAIAAVVALAAVAGALGGALATASLHAWRQRCSRRRQPDACWKRRSRGSTADIQALKAGLEHTSKTRHEPVQQDQRASRQGREGPGRTGGQARQAQRSRRKAARGRPAPAMAAMAAPAASATAKEAPARSDLPRLSDRGCVSRRQDRPQGRETEVGRLPTLDDWVLRDVAMAAR